MMTDTILDTLRQDRRNYLLPFDQGRQYLIVIYQGRQMTDHPVKAAAVRELLDAEMLRWDGVRLWLK